MIDGHVVGDLEQPARKLELGPIPIDVVEDLDERVLREVLGELAIAHHAIDQRDSVPLVPSDHLAKRRLTPPLRERDDIGVRQIEEVEGCGRCGRHRRCGARATAPRRAWSETKYVSPLSQTSVLACFAPRGTATFANARDG